MDYKTSPLPQLGRKLIVLRANNKLRIRNFEYTRTIHLNRIHGLLKVLELCDTLEVQALVADQLLHSERIIANITKSLNAVLELRINEILKSTKCLK